MFFLAAIGLTQRLISGLSHRDNMMFLSSIIYPACLKDMLKTFSKTFKDTVELVLCKVRLLLTA